MTTWRWLLLALASGCALHTFEVPRPLFSTREPSGAFARAVEATRAHCGGVRDVNEESQVVVGPWQAWNTPHGLLLTQCLVTLQRGDEHVHEVRVTFGARRCPLSSMDDLEALAPSCPPAEQVPQIVATGLAQIARKLEADIVR